MILIVKWILVFFAVALADGAWTLYMQGVAEQRKWKASLASVVIIALGAFTAISYIEDKTLLIPALFGAFVGTFVTMTLHETKAHV
jgi:hypothetical protein